MKPRCLITGSRYGLGQALVQRFCTDYEIIEYDLQLGQNLSSPEVRDQVIQDLASCRLFFLNSHASQLELLNRAHDLQNDLVIVVSNSSSVFYDYQPQDLAVSEEFQQHVEEKRTLTERCRQIQNQQAQGQQQRSWIINLLIGWIDTNTNQLRPEPKLSADQLADFIAQVIDQWPRGLAVQELVVISPDLGDLDSQDS
jgi:hypothetical protein